MKDEELIELFRNRDENAITITEERYRPYCFALACNILLRKEDAEECVNDTWLKAWQSIPPNSPSSLAAYLAKITRNLSFNKYKAMKAEKRGGGEVELALDELLECVTGTSGPERELDQIETGRIINAFMASLPLRERNIFIRRYWAVEPIAAIAARYGVKENAVRVSLFRTRGKLKVYLEKEGSAT